MYKRQLVEDAKRSGADFIKIMISGLMDFDRLGVLTDVPLTPEEIHARTGTHAGSRQRLAFTRIGGKLWTIRLAADAPETGREG